MVEADAIYADHAATAPCDPEVAALVATLLGEAGNPSSRHHRPGRRAAERLDRAREQLAAAIAAPDPAGIVCTSGATEACNQAIFGILSRSLPERPRLVIGATEHPAIQQPASVAAGAGAEVVVVPVDAAGRWDLAALEAACDQRCALVACMLVNNETGVVNPVADIAERAHAVGALLVCDATQALGRLPVDVASLQADCLACSSHKIGGPPGAGLLWIRRGLAPAPLIHGGGQEKGRRSGTENLPAIAGFGLAAERAATGIDARQAQLQTLTTRLETGLSAAIPALRIYGAEAPRAPGITFCGLPGLRHGLLAQMGPIAASAGSSCASGNRHGSAVLRAMGVDERDASHALRLSFGPGNTTAEVDRIIERVVRGITRLRE